MCHTRVKESSIHPYKFYGSLPKPMTGKSAFKKLILNNAQSITQLQAEIHRCAKIRDIDPIQYDNWVKACAKMQEEYDRLAFPQYGLSEGIQRLKNQDQTAIDLWILFLATDPYFFRSGYIKADVLRYFKKINFTKQQVKDLKEVLIITIQKQRSLFRKYCLFAKYIYDEDLKRRLLELCQSADKNITNRAHEMLKICDPKALQKIS